MVNILFMLNNLFKNNYDVSDDNYDEEWYMVIKHKDDINYETAIYWMYPVSQWENNGREPTDTVPGATVSTQWLCVPIAGYVE